MKKLSNTEAELKNECVVDKVGRKKKTLINQLFTF